METVTQLSFEDIHTLTDIRHRDISELRDEFAVFTCQCKAVTRTWKEACHADRGDCRQLRKSNEKLHRAIVSEPFFKSNTKCIDPAESAQVKPLMHMPQRAFSCPAPDVGVGCCKS
jgi:hypothetical protein